MAIQYSYEYINFRILSEGKKTNVYTCYNNRSVAALGTVKWYGPWRQYCFYPDAEMVFNKGCLNDISNFMEALMLERK